MVEEWSGGGWSGGVVEGGVVEEWSGGGVECGGVVEGGVVEEWSGGNHREFNCRVFPYSSPPILRSSGPPAPHPTVPPASGVRVRIIVEEPPGFT